MTEEKKLTRSERLLLAAAVLRGTVAGATNATLTWLARQLTS